MINQDLRNHGESTHSPVHNYEVMADDVAAFIKEHKFNKIVIMGHSMYESLNFLHITTTIIIIKLL